MCCPGVLKKGHFDAYDEISFFTPLFICANKATFGLKKTPLKKSETDYAT